MDQARAALRYDCDRPILRSGIGTRVCVPLRMIATGRGVFSLRIGLAAALVVGGLYWRREPSGDGKKLAKILVIAQSRGS